MSFYRPAPHLYSVTLTVGGIRVEARHHSLSEALRHSVEKVAENRKGSEEVVRVAKQAASRLLAAWREMKRPDSVRLHPSEACRAKIEMTRV